MTVSMDLFYLVKMDLWEGKYLHHHSAEPIIFLFLTGCYWFELCC